MAQFPSDTVGYGVWSLNEIRNAVRGGNWPTTTPTVVLDPEFANVVLLLHGDGTNGSQNNTFLDSSSNNFTITRNGNTTQGSYSPYGDRWSNYFDGTGDYLTGPTNSAFDPASGDFTIEAWLYPTDSGTQEYFMASRPSSSESGWAFVKNGTGTIQFAGWSGGNVVVAVNSNTAISQNSWSHVAAVRSGAGNWTIYINGVSDASGTETNTIAAGSTLHIGRDPARTDGSRDYTGYMVDARIIKGTALYTSNFTPPTEPLTAVSGTSLLTCQSNRFKDNSSNDFAITVNGDTKVTPFSPYAPSAAYDPATGGGSGYFDGTGDYLTTPYSATEFDWWTDDYTIEAWIYPTTFTGWYYTGGIGDTGTLVGNMLATGLANYWSFGITSTGAVRLVYFNGSAVNTPSSTNTVNLNQWNHIAVIKDSSGYKYFVNGVGESYNSISGTPQSDTATGLTVGARNSEYINGYVSDLRIVKGTALYTSSFTPPTAPLTAVTNTSLLCNFTNAGIFDSTGKNVLETVGNAQIDTAVTKFGTGSMEFDGTGDYLSYPTTTTASKFEGADFTLECWVYVTDVSSNREIYSGRDGANRTGPVFRIEAGGQVGVLIASSSSVWGVNTTSSPEGNSVPLNQWSHIAITRDGTSLRVFIDGVLQYTKTINFDVYWPSLTARIGSDAGSSSIMLGYIDDLRITKGVARYTANFTPPTAPFPDQ